MKVTEIQFNKHIGIKESNNDKYLLMLEHSEITLNHLGTVHAGAQFSLAEATSGYFLLKSFGRVADSVIPVVRKSEMKFKKPATGTIYSTADFIDTSVEKVLNELEDKRRTLISIETKVFDHQNHVLSAVFEWFIQKI